MSNFKVKLYSEKQHPDFKHDFIRDDSGEELWYFFVKRGVSKVYSIIAYKSYISSMYINTWQKTEITKAVEDGKDYKGSMYEEL